MPSAVTSTTSRTNPPGAAERKPMASGTMDIITAMRDPALFGPHFKGDSWQAWQAFLAALFALPMDDDALAIYQKHTGRATAPERQFREAVLICGRQGRTARRWSR